MSLSGCGLMVIFPTYSKPINQSLSEETSKIPDSLCVDLPYKPVEKNKIVLILSFSGGGKRAAAYAYGVMRALEEEQFIRNVNGTLQVTNLLYEIDYISAVSGGSVPATYYAIQRNSTENNKQDFGPLEDFLFEDTEWILIGRMLNPINWFKSSTQVFAEYIDETLFSHQTFAKVLGRKPILLITASDLTRGHRFVFTESQFRCLGSNLHSYPLAYGVAASASYPLFFSTVALKNFNSVSKEEEKDPERVTFKKHDYVILTDGGVLDNLATRVYVDLFEKGYLLGKSVKENQLAKALGWIKVNGSARFEPQFHKSSHSPNGFSRLWRAAEIISEYQMEESDDRFKYNLATKLGPNVGFKFLDIDLNEYPYQTEVMPTSWSLPRKNIETLICAGYRKIRNYDHKLKVIKKWFQSKGDVPGEKPMQKRCERR